MNKFSEDIMRLRYSWNGEESWEDIARRVVSNVMSAVPAPRDVVEGIERAIIERKFIPGGRFLAQAGRGYHQTNNCFLLRVEDTREGWGELTNKATVMLMSGGGIGIDYSALRPSGSILKRTGGTASGPLPLMKAVNEIGRGVMSGGRRRSAIWAGLSWKHDDIFDFIRLKNWIPEVRKLKEKDFDFPAPMDMTNISVILDNDFFVAYDNPNHTLHSRAQDVYWQTVDRMVRTGEPGFSVDVANPYESLRNACTEIVSSDDCDVCCLGSVNLGRIESVEELHTVSALGTVFLLAGTEYSDVPYPKVKEVRERNRRIGLGLMGIHEWLIKRGYYYEPNDQLQDWLHTWRDASDLASIIWSQQFSFCEPIAKRAIAPNGTISIAGGMTTSGIEPIFAVAYQRRYMTPDGWKKQYVVDPVAERLVREGVRPETIEDAYSLSMDVERRIIFQAFVQRFVDNGISSTINLPAFGQPGNDSKEAFGNKLIRWLPMMRGITAFPDGGRGSAQPITVVDYNYAVSRRGVVFEANEECAGGVCGI